jgi:YidC/Oxa1 family membrane protein insertase
MDKNTITGLILIFLIFIGFSIYNNNRLNKGFEEAVAAAETEIQNGNLERARTEYVNALRFKPNDPEVLKKINDLNVDLGITEDIQPEDTLETDLSVTHQSQSQTQSQKKPSSYSDPGQYGVFANAATGQNDFITLENNLLELKISTKGGRVYSARLKNYVTHDSRPLILFSGDQQYLVLISSRQTIKLFRQITFILSQFQIFVHIQSKKILSVSYSD